MKWSEIPIHHDAALRDALGRALFLMRDFDGVPFRWSDEAEPKPEAVPTLSEETREEWRRLADRMAIVLGPMCGFSVVTDRGSK